jgi:hypothetical protein
LGIEILDTIDGDADLEDGGDGEPSLASPVGRESQLCWAAGCDDGREQDVQSAARAAQNASMRKWVTCYQDLDVGQRFETVRRHREYHLTA